MIKVDGFSAHADKDELLQWISSFQNNPPRKVFITHGEEEVSKDICRRCGQQKLGFITERPSRGDKYVLD